LAPIEFHRFSRISFKRAFNVPFASCNRRATSTGPDTDGKIPHKWLIPHLYLNFLIFTSAISEPERSGVGLLSLIASAAVRWYVGAVKWYYAVGNQPVGPVDRVELESLYQAGTITASTLVLQEGMYDWVPLVDLKKTTQFIPTMSDKVKINKDIESGSNRPPVPETALKPGHG
jgi:hypothetical protein